MSIENKENLKLPSLLDIVKIDGRWAQVRAGGNTVLFLDDGDAQPIDWDDYELDRHDGRALIYTKESLELEPEEILRIHWGPEEKIKPSLKLECTYFGDFIKKEQNK